MRLMRRKSRGNEPHFIKHERFVHLFGRPEVPIVNRVKCPAYNPDAQALSLVFLLFLNQNEIVSVNYLIVVLASKNRGDFPGLFPGDSGSILT